MREQLVATLEKNKEHYIKRLTDLVSLDTQCVGHGIKGGHEKNGQEYMLKLFGEMGASNVEVDQMSEEVIQKAIREFQEGNPGHNYDDRYNVYATFKGKGGKSLMFNGHMDTMPHGDLSLWTSHPLKPEIRDGKMYGLGTTDMKSGLMASVMAVQLLKDAGIELPGDVIITSVADEEGGGNGSIQAAMNGQKADAVVVCEPSNGVLYTCHNGFVFFKVEIEGRAVHSATKWEGVSAIEKAIKIIAVLDELEHRWLLTHKHPMLVPPSGNVGEIEGGKAGSTVADYCCFKTCVHYNPGMTYDSVVKEYTEAIYRCCEGDEWLKDHKPKISIYQAGGSFETDVEHEFVKTFQKSLETTTGTYGVVAGNPGGCDARVWRNIAGCPTVHNGPGELSTSHSIDEHVYVDDYLRSILIYAGLILDWCK